MSAFMAVLLSLSIVIITLLFMIYYLCGDIIMEKYFEKQNKKVQSILRILLVIYLIIYMSYKIYNYVN